MTPTYSIETIAEEVAPLGLPFPTLIAQCLVALLACRKATLHHVANLLPTNKSREANRQKIRRFLDHPALNGDCWAKAIAALLPVRAPWVIAIDRTQWDVGKTTINLLVLSVVCSGCAVPLIWFVFDKPGNSDTWERIALLEEFIALFGRQKIDYITADREFIGREWIDWLLKSNIAFRIRIKANEYLTSAAGEKRKAAQWFSPGSAAPARPMEIWGLPVFVEGKRLSKTNEYVIVIGNEAGNLLEQYRLRWKIETLFQAFKGRGFDLESSHLTDWSRIWAWFGFLSLALVWCLRVGEFLDQRCPLVIKKHGRRAQSVFRRGLDYLQQVLAPLAGMSGLSCFLPLIALLRPLEAS